SASSGYGVIRWSWAEDRVLREHLLRVGVGLVFFLVSYLIRPSWLGTLSRLGYWVAIGALAFTVASRSVGAINGAKRWISVAMFSLQPAEFAKLALIAHLAWMASRRDARIDEWSGLAPALWKTALMCGLVLLQPNFSTAAALAMVAFAILVSSGMNWKHIGILGASALIGSLLIMAAQPYRVLRIKAFFHPEENALGSALQSLQALIALGNGGLTGVGLGRGTAKLMHLPEPYTDTIFAVLGEEMGMIGTLVILGLFLVLVWRGTRIALLSRNPQFRLLAVGITTALGLYAVLHAMVCTRLIPTTGLPMPFVSYGGSNLSFSMLGLGLLLNLSRRLSETEPEPVHSNPFARAVRAPSTTTQRRVAWD
ncbi:MAG TPA: FtsW/RodA/SpoVE family cell cycle protein, partial [Fibrobacteria bacterium]|nr:FtsW/RodA/SpoVE family cell cycle protein [Fibrobacteria bacterium]